MNCLNPGEKDPSLLANGHSSSPVDGVGLATSYTTDRHIKSLRKQVRLALAGLAGLLALSLALLGLVIWLAVEMHDNRAAINALAASGVSGSSSSLAAQLSGDPSDEALLSASFPAAYLSLSPNTSDGYSYSGSLFRGSGVLLCTVCICSVE